jgi:hypothetical protein
MTSLVFVTPIHAVYVSTDRQGQLLSAASSVVTLA